MAAFWDWASKILEQSGVWVAVSLMASFLVCFAQGNDPFLNEHTDSLNPNGRVRRAEFKGLVWPGMAWELRESGETNQTNR